MRFIWVAKRAFIFLYRVAQQCARSGAWRGAPDRSDSPWAFHDSQLTPMRQQIVPEGLCKPQGVLQGHVSSRVWPLELACVFSCPPEVPPLPLSVGI
jgi:hypothetical protein